MQRTEVADPEEYGMKGVCTKDEVRCSYPLKSTVAKYKVADPDDEGGNSSVYKG